FSSFFAPAANENRRHAIRSFHLSRRDAFFIDPDEMTGGGPNDGERNALDDSYSKSIGQDTRDGCASHAGQFLNFSADGRKISFPNAGVTHGFSGNSFNLVSRNSRRSGDVNVSDLKQRGRSCDAITDHESNYDQ